MTIILAAAFCVQASAQSVISGRVSDTAGEALIGANVYIESTFLGAISDVNGNYLINGLPKDSYTVKASYVGFETEVKEIEFEGELIINFKDIDVKKGFALNEIVQLPKTSSPATVCVIATGDMSQKAKEANADSVIGTEELDKFATNKRESRKFINKYDFFLADTKVMPLVGKTLGQLLGPRGKLPTPVPFPTVPVHWF